jgi:hypothetical protein
MVYDLKEFFPEFGYFVNILNLAADQFLLIQPSAHDPVLRLSLFWAIPELHAINAKVKRQGAHSTDGGLAQSAGRRGGIHCDHGRSEG